MVPTFVIIPLFFAAFVVTCWQYFRIDAKQRVLNLRFAMMIVAIAGAFGYPIITLVSRGNRHASWLFLALGLFLLATAYYLLRRMPIRRG